MINLILLLTLWKFTINNDTIYIDTASIDVDYIDRVITIKTDIIFSNGFEL